MRLLKRMWRLQGFEALKYPAFGLETHTPLDLGARELTIEYNPASAN